MVRRFFSARFTSSIRRIQCEGNSNLRLVSFVSFVVNFLRISQAVRVTGTTKYTNYTKE